MSSVDAFKAKVSADRGLARSNLYAVTLPEFGENGRDLNVLCKATQIPGKALSTAERAHGVVPRQIVTGVMYEPISLTFHLTNTYKIKKYFDAWQNLMVSNEQSNVINYYDSFVRSVVIRQIRKGESFAVASVRSPIDLGVPGIIRDRLPSLGIPNIGGTGIGAGGVDIGDVISGGNINLAIFTQENVIYECELKEAYPTRISAIQLSDELDGLVELTVDLTYHKWIDKQAETDNTNIGDEVNDAIGNILNTAINATGLSGFIR